ncbi:type VI secretion system baseplate subunit TssK [Enterobacter cloacae subsp. cloacae]|nr:type VI secretion system baseplate subunit TssK [Enterobacter cloacae subsp. cloacae]
MGALQRSYLWGFLDVELDEAMFSPWLHCPELCQRCATRRYVFPVRNGRNGPAPLKIPDNLTNEKVVLALPVRRESVKEVIFSEEPASLARLSPSNRRWKTITPMSVGDAAVQFGRLRLTLMLEKI